METVKIQDVTITFKKVILNSVTKKVEEVRFDVEFDDEDDKEDNGVYMISSRNDDLTTFLGKIWIDPTDYNKAKIHNYISLLCDEMPVNWNV